MIHQQVINILNSYSGKDNYGDIASKFFDVLSSPEVIVSVIGMQGMGKSTLINALLKENMLPNKADETTCVPVEVRYNENAGTQVFFLDGKKTVIQEKVDLSQYVDNNFNPGNEKGVARIVVFRKLNLLKSGLVLVDLPGVGSLTANNEKTTMEYIKKVSFAIMLVPTVPTIRKMEEIFIKSLWKTFSRLLFVQNIFGETKREVAESLEYNDSILSQISGELNVAKDEIIPVNAYDAAYGAINGAIDKYDSSNIRTLISQLEYFTTTDQEKVKSTALKNIVSLIDEVKIKIENLISESKMTAKELEKKFERIEEDYKKNSGILIEEIDGITRLLKRKKRQMHTFSLKVAREHTETLRSGVFKLIDSGIVDGPQLTQAFNDLQNQSISNVIEETFDEMSKVIEEINEKLQDLQNLILDENEHSYRSAEFNKKESFKFEKGLEVGVDLVGAVGGTIATFAIIGSIGGPVGTIVGIGAGILIGITAGFIGSGSKKAILQQRGKTTKIELEPYINNFNSKVKEIIQCEFGLAEEKITQVLEDYSKDRKEYFNVIKKENIEKVKLAQSGQDMEPLIEQYEKDRKLLEELGGEASWI